MKLGIFSDVHGNLEAFEAVLGFLREQGVAEFACCGDIVGYGPDPRACIERMKSLGAAVVAGNHDCGVVGRVDPADFNAAARNALEWTSGQLTEDDLAYLGSLPFTRQFGSFFLVHASPSAPERWGYVLAVREAEEEMEYFPSVGCVIGHSHYPFVVERRPGEPARLLDDSCFVMRSDSKYVINAGSVGQPRDGDPRACCLIQDTETGAVAFHRVDYSISKVQAKMTRAGLPGFLIDRLSLGR